MTTPPQNSRHGVSTNPHRVALTSNRPQITNGIRVNEPCGYEPASDRSEWLNRDSIAEEGGLNLYGYVENDPINYVDELGLAPTLRDLINAGITVAVMSYQALTGNPADIKAPRTPNSQRVEMEDRVRTEKKRRPRKPNAKARCILYDPFDDLDLILDYDVDKTFHQNLRDKYDDPLPPT